MDKANLKIEDEIHSLDAPFIVELLDIGPLIPSTSMPLTYGDESTNRGDRKRVKSVVDEERKRKRELFLIMTFYIFSQD